MYGVKYTPEMKGKNLCTILKAHGLKVTDKIPGIAIGVKDIGQQGKKTHKLVKKMAQQMGIAESDEEGEKKEEGKKEVEQQEEQKPEAEEKKAEEKKAEEAPAAESTAAPAAEAVAAPAAESAARPPSDGESSESEEGESSESEEGEGSESEEEEEELPSDKEQWTLEHWKKHAQGFCDAMQQARSKAYYWEKKALELQTENEALKRAPQQRTEEAEKKKAKHT